MEREDLWAGFEVGGDWWAMICPACDHATLTWKGERPESCLGCRVKQLEDERAEA